MYRILTRLPLLISHTCTLPSLLPEIRRLPSFENARLVILSVCPVRIKAGTFGLTDFQIKPPAIIKAAAKRMIEKACFQINLRAGTLAAEGFFCITGGTANCSAAGSWMVDRGVIAGVGASVTGCARADGDVR